MSDSAPWSSVRHKPGREVSGEQPQREGSGGSGSQETQQESAVCVSWQPGRQTSPWGASNTARLTVQRGDYPPVPIIVGLISKVMCNSGSCYWRRMWRSLNVFCQGHQSRWRGWQECALSSGWGHCVCVVWSEGSWGVISLLPTASWGEEVLRYWEVLSSSPW